MKASNPVRCGLKEPGSRRAKSEATQDTTPDPGPAPQHPKPPEPTATTPTTTPPTPPPPHQRPNEPTLVEPPRTHPSEYAPTQTRPQEARPPHHNVNPSPHARQPPRTRPAARRQPRPPDTEARVTTVHHQWQASHSERDKLGFRGDNRGFQVPPPTHHRASTSRQASPLTAPETVTQDGGITRSCDQTVTKFDQMTRSLGQATRLNWSFRAKMWCRRGDSNPHVLSDTKDPKAGTTTHLTDVAHRAGGGTRTPTSSRTPGPKPGASAGSATPA